MKILLINPKWFDTNFFVFPIGLAQIATILEKHKHKIYVLDYDILRTKEIPFSNVPFTPDVIAIGGMITTFKSVVNIIIQVRKKYNNIPVILGGGLATTAPDWMLKKTGADIFVIGEAENTIITLLENISSPTKVKNIKKINSDGQLLMTEVDDAPPDIYENPAINYSLFPTEKYIEYCNKTNRAFDLYSSKGCPFDCTFCYKISKKKVRYRSLEIIAEEINYLKKTYGINRFRFVDDNFGANKKWLSSFLEFAAKNDIKYCIQSSIHLLWDKKKLSDLKKTGLYSLTMGIESGSPQILKEMQKQISLDKASDVMKWCRELGIAYYGSFIIAYPSENDKTINQTIQFLIKNGFKTNFNLNFLALYPKTKIYQYAINNGLLIDEKKYLENIGFRNELFVNLTKFPDKTLYSWRDKILKKIAQHHGIAHTDPGLNFLRIKNVGE